MRRRRWATVIESCWNIRWRFDQLLRKNHHQSCHSFWGPLYIISLLLWKHYKYLFYEQQNFKTEAKKTREIRKETPKRRNQRKRFSDRRCRGKHTLMIIWCAKSRATIWRLLPLSAMMAVCGPRAPPSPRSFLIYFFVCWLPYLIII